MKNCDASNLAYIEWNADIFKIPAGLQAYMFTSVYLSPMPQNVQVLEVRQLEHFLRCMKEKYATCLLNLRNHPPTPPPHSRESAMFVSHKQVLSLAIPNFLT